MRGKKNSRLENAHNAFNQAAEILDILVSAMHPHDKISMDEVLEVIRDDSVHGDFMNAQILRLYRKANPEALVGVRGVGLFHLGPPKVHSVTRDGKKVTKKFSVKNFLRSRHSKGRKAA